MSLLRAARANKQAVEIKKENPAAKKVKTDEGEGSGTAGSRIDLTK